MQTSYVAQSYFSPYIEQRRAYRDVRRLRRIKLRDRGIKPCQRKFVYCVTTTAIPVPPGMRALFPEVSRGPQTIWLSRNKARHLCELDRLYGGTPTMVETEYRRCPQCKRLMLGEDAVMRRKLDEVITRASVDREAPCGPDCYKRRDRKKAA